MENFPTWLCVVAVALGDDGGRWLMHRRPEGKHHAGLWEFPGGKVEQSETPAQALVREIREELGIGIDLDTLDPAGFAQTPEAEPGRRIVILLYTCRSWTGSPAALEGGEIAWFTPQEARALPRPPLDVDLCEQLFSRSAQ